MNQAHQQTGAQAPVDLGVRPCPPDPDPLLNLQQKYITEFQREKEEFEKNMARFK